MKTNQNEFLSAVLDDEAGEFERRRLLDELCDNAELGQTLNRYSLVGEAMRSRRQTVVVDGEDFLAGIRSRLEDEPVYDEVVVPAAVNDVVRGGLQDGRRGNDVNQVPVPVKRPWYRDNTARYAVAASVAVAVLAGVLWVQNTGLQPTGSEMLAKTESPIAMEPVVVANNKPTTAGNVPVAGSRPVIGSNRMRLANATSQRASDTLKQYVTLHMQYRSSNGIAPSIQAVSYAK